MSLGALSTNPVVLIADIIIIGIIVLQAVIGYKKGLASIIVGRLCLILAILATYFLYPFAAELFTRSGLEEALADRLELSLVEEAASEENSEGVRGELPEDFSIDDLKLPEILKEYLNRSNDEANYDQFGATSLEGYVRGYIARLMVSGIVIILTFILCLIGIILLAKALQLLNEVPVIGTINQVAGLAVGIITALIILEGAVFLLIMLSSSVPALGDLVLQMEEGVISGFILRYNRISDWLLSWVETLLVQ